MSKTRRLENLFRNIEQKQEAKLDMALYQSDAYYETLFKNLLEKNKNPNVTIQMEPFEAIGILNCVFQHPNLCPTLVKDYFNIENNMQPKFTGTNLFMSYFRKAFTGLLENLSENNKGVANPAWKDHFSKHPEEMIIMNGWLETFLQRLHDPKNSKFLPSRDLKNYVQEHLPEIINERIFQQNKVKANKNKPDLLVLAYESVSDPMSLQITKFKLFLDKYIELRKGNLDSNLIKAQDLRGLISETYNGPNQKSYDIILGAITKLFNAPTTDPVLLNLLYQSSLLEVTSPPQKSYAELSNEMNSIDLTAFKSRAVDRFDSWNTKRKNLSTFDKEADSIDRSPHLAQEKINFYFKKYKNADENKLTLEEKVRCFNTFVEPLLARDSQNTQLNDEASLKNSLELLAKLDDQTKWDLSKTLFQYSSFKAGMSVDSPKEFDEIKNLNRLQAFRIATELDLNCSPAFTQNIRKNVDNVLVKTKMLDKLQTINELDYYNWMSFIDKIDKQINPQQNENKPIPKNLATALTNFIEQFENATGEARFSKRHELITGLLQEITQIKKDKKDIEKFMSSPAGKSLSASLESIRSKAFTEKNYDGKIDNNIIKVYRAMIKSESAKLESQPDQKSTEKKVTSLDSSTQMRR